jgi:hypothetical protein
MIPPLQITQTFGQISIQQDNGGVRIQQPEAKMEISTELPEIEIEKTMGNLKIDQSKAWAAYGIMSPLEMISRIYSESRNIALRATEKTAKEGDRMAAVHQSKDVIAELAKENSFGFLDVEFAGKASGNNVDIDFTHGTLDVGYLISSVNIQVQPQKPIIESVPAQVSVGMNEYPSIQISVTGQQIDQFI